MVYSRPVTFLKLGVLPARSSIFLGMSVASFLQAIYSLVAQHSSEGNSLLMLLQKFLCMHNVPYGDLRQMRRSACTVIVMVFCTSVCRGLFTFMALCIRLFGIIFVTIYEGRTTRLELVVLLD